MSNLSKAIFKFLIAILLFSASTFNRWSLCSAAGFSESSNGVPEGRGSFPNPNCTLRFWMTASRSCNADLISFAGELSDRVQGCDLTEALVLITLPLLFLRLGALLHSETSILAIWREIKRDEWSWKRGAMEKFQTYLNRSKEGGPPELNYIFRSGIYVRLFTPWLRRSSEDPIEIRE